MRHLRKLSTSVDPMEMKRFAHQAKEWYNLKGPYEVLLRMNPLRTNYIRNTLKPSSGDRPFTGLNILDIGCGGGFLSQASIGLN
jgi:2-polyprenyl-6-hydroxyphenyl methylase / 3-demethylubiquinone-9 3-methyltransferase